MNFQSYKVWGCWELSGQKKRVLRMRTKRTRDRQTAEMLGEQMQVGVGMMASTSASVDRSSDAWMPPHCTTGQKETIPTTSPKPETTSRRALKKFKRDSSEFSNELT